METDELVEQILRTIPNLIQAVKTSTASLCAGFDERGTSPTPMVEMTVTQIRALMVLYYRGKLPVGDVAEGMGVTIATGSQQIDRLVSAGWLERTANPDDRRQVLISLTERAEQVAKRIYEVRQSQVRAALETLSTEERAAVPRAIAAFIAALNSPLEHGVNERAEARPIRIDDV